MEEKLTLGQRRITRLAALGYRNDEIASTLGIAEQTVKNQMHRAFRRVDVDSRAELVQKVYQLELPLRSQ